MTQTQDWWQAFYEETPFELFMERKDPAEVGRTIRFLIEQLKITPGATVFDQCCGFGSLSIPLSERGFNVVGVDLCSKYIEQAGKEAAQKRLKADFYRGDAFDFITPKECDAGFNWWTSFGYADWDMRNVSMLQRAADSLKKRGRFALDYPNMPHVLRNYTALEVREFKNADGDVRIERATKIDLERGARVQRWTFSLPDGRQLAHDTSLRLYMPHQIKEMMQSAGFKEITFFGDVDGTRLSIDSPRCIAIGTKG